MGDREVLLGLERAVSVAQQYGESARRGHHQVELTVLAKVRRFQPVEVRGAGALEWSQHARVERAAAFAREKPYAAAADGGNVGNAIAVEVANGDVVRVGVRAGLVEDSGLEGAIAIAQRDANTPSPPSLTLGSGQRLMVAVQIGYREGERRHTGVQNGARAERAVATAEEYCHGALAVPLDYVRCSIAIGISHGYPGAVVRVVAPCVKGRLGGLRCGEDIDACQAQQEERRGN